ncbi:hypothetical protein HY490_05155 [Candidatus Woesearchaeota archaeon]|nr:hypothetical protein [Candidatus Woesearchaeota archaeon]
MARDEYAGKGALLLVKYGFFRKDLDKEKKDKYTDWEKFNASLKAAKPEDREKMLHQVEWDADVDWMEVQRDQMVSMPYPKPISRYHAIYESFHEAIEPIYFWCLNHATFDWGFPVVHKVTDIFAASEHSTFYGAAAQRLGLGQDKVSAYLATIGKMTKDLFSLVRELRWMDERYRFYKDVFVPEKAETDAEKQRNEKRRLDAETVLKGLWVDLVDGVVQGQRTAVNLFSMAQQLQFASLPPVFFSTHPKNRDEINDLVEPRGYPRDMKIAMIRKLEQYLAWRDSTYLEMKNRRKFTIDYLRQHYEVIRMYIQWVKPYLRHIEKLTAAAPYLNRAELISSFEGSMLEIEFLAQKLAFPENKEVYSCLLMTFEYKTKPQMSFQSEGYQHRGPLHVGETKITWRSYAWTQKQINEYLKMKADEDFALLAGIDDSLKSAMAALGDDLQKYLTEQQEELKKEEKTEEKKEETSGPSAWSMFGDIGRGFGDLFKAFVPASAPRPVQERGPSDADRDSAKGAAKFLCFQHFKNFKKAHGMVTW